jgi:hypothetical protein
VDSDCRSDSASGSENPYTRMASPRSMAGQVMTLLICHAEFQQGGARDELSRCRTRWPPTRAAAIRRPLLTPRRSGGGLPATKSRMRCRRSSVRYSSAPASPTLVMRHPRHRWDLSHATASVRAVGRQVPVHLLRPPWRNDRHRTRGRQYPLNNSSYYSGDVDDRNPQ